MKKTLIALSVLVAAGSVNAATVYQNDGLSADVYGDLEVRYAQEVGATTEAVIKPADYDFGFKVNSAINDDMSIFGDMAFDGNESIDGTGNVSIDNAYMGFKTGALTVTAGRVVNFVDEVGVANDEAIAGNYEANDGLSTKSSQVIKVVYDDGGMFYGGFASTAEKNNNDTQADASQIDVKLGLRVENLDVFAVYADAETAAGADIDGLAIEAHYDIDAISLGALYTTGDNAGTESDAISLSVAYSMDKATVGAGWSTIDTDGAEDKSQWYANASYAVAKNASVYAEIADTDVDGEDMGYAVGAKIKF